MRVGLVVGVALLSLACVGVVAANEPPLADAGLDQDGEVNATVYLDAGGSMDSDGSIVGYEWSIESPDGTVMSPDCPTCSQTWFVPAQTGRYNVTVRVTDDAGASVEDTLYVQVGRATSTSPPPSTPAAAPQPLTQPATARPIFMPGVGEHSGGGGGGGSGSPGSRSNAMIVREGGNLYLAGSESMETLVVEGPGGQNIEVSGRKFRNAQTTAGLAPLSEFRNEMAAVGVSMEDANNAVDAAGGSCGTSAGGSCTTGVDQGTLDVDERLSDLDFSGGLSTPTVDTSDVGPVDVDVDPITSVDTASPDIDTNGSVDVDLDGTTDVTIDLDADDIEVNVGTLII